MDHQKLNYRIHTYGCKVNTYDSGLIQRRLSRVGFEEKSNEVQGPGVHILNTCAVTREATREAVRQIRRIKAKDPLATVVVTGCAAQVDGKDFDSLPGADLVIANSHKGELPSILTDYFKGNIKERVFRSNIFRRSDLGEGGGVESGHTRSFLKIQDGCNSFCSFCVIPYARGTSRSLSVVSLVRKINELYDQGVREVVLTGVHIGDYEDTRPGMESRRLEDLVETVLERTQMPRLRISSLEPIELSDRLLDLYQDSRLCPHFHMSIQSAQSEVLKRMKRKYTAEQVVDSLERISQRVPGAFVGMDVIVGFPGESEKAFVETYQRLAESDWTRIHVFPYSERPGTKATLLDDSVAMPVRKERAQRMRALSLERYHIKAADQIGTLKQVLILEKSDRQGRRQGLTRDYWPVTLDGDPGHDAVGSEVQAEIAGYDRGADGQKEGGLYGRVAQ